MRQPRRIRTQNNSLRNPIHQQSFKEFSASKHSLKTHLLLMDRKLSGHCQGAGQKRAFGAWTKGPLLKPAIEHGLEFDTVFDNESTDPYRAMHFVGREGQRVDIQRLKVDWDFSDSLYGIGVDRDSGGFAQSNGLLNRLQNTRFVVGKHDRYGCDRIALLDPLSERMDIDLTILFAWQVSNFPALLLEPLSHRQNAWMLDRRNDEAALAFCDQSV